MRSVEYQERGRRGPPLFLSRECLNGHECILWKPGPKNERMVSFIRDLYKASHHSSALP
jgi:hypothetical protein